MLLKRSSAFVPMAVLVLLMGASAGITKAQQYLYAHSARSSAMGSCFTYYDEGQHAEVSYKAGFALAELAEKRFGTTLRVARRGVAVLAYSQTGSSVYREQQAYAGYMMQVADRLRVGIGARWGRVGVDDAHYEPVWQLVPEVGAQWRCGTATMGLMIGVGSMARVAEQFRLRAQMAYCPVSRMLLIVEVDREEVWRLRAGTEWLAADRVALRAGLSTSPIVPSVGIGLRERQMSLDLSVESMSRLGLTPQLSLSVWF